MICIDEFPYLVESDPTLPSVMQRFLDHKNKNVLFVLAGSSWHMMSDIFLTQSAPLYERALRLIRLKPMEYRYFCQYAKLKPNDRESFRIYSLVGGIPKFWSYLSTKESMLANAERLYFGDTSMMEFEPRRLLIDEKLDLSIPRSVLEAVGRKAERSSEIAALIGVKQNTLSKYLAQLLDAFLIKKEVPFGENTELSKLGLYQLDDPMLLFWYRTFSPHRSRWFGYSKKEQDDLLNEHASKVFENFVRETISKTKLQRYWEKGIEFDGVEFVTKNKIRIVEVKFKKLKQSEVAQIEQSVKEDFIRSKLVKKFELIKVDVIDLTYLDNF